MKSFQQIQLKASGLEFSALEAGKGPVVLCLHGFPDCLRSFREQLPALAEAGYRAVAPALRGYEPSSQPADGDYHMVRMAEDVVGWIDHLGEDRVHLVGHDWGAVIGYAAAARSPERFASLTTLAVPHPARLQQGIRRHPRQLRLSWYMFFFQLRGIADWTVRRNDYAFLERLWRDWSPGWEWPEEEMEALKATFRAPGVQRAALAYYRAFFAPWGEASRETLRLLESPVPVPTLALTGSTDGCMDTRLYDVAMDEREFPAGLRVERIQGAGHFLHQEKPEAVNPLLLDWLRQHEA